MRESDLEDLAEKHGHTIHSVSLSEAPAFSVEDSLSRCHIAISDQATGPTRAVLLAHELGHCEYGGFYNYHSLFSIRSKCEAKADRWAYIHMLPISDIQDAIHEGCENIYDLSERCGVTPEFAAKAIRFYVDQLGQSLR